MSKGSALVSILFAFFAGVVIGHVTAGPSAEKPAAEVAQEAETDVKAVDEKDGPERFKVPVTAAQPSKGPADALVTIVVHRGVHEQGGHGR